MAVTLGLYTSMECQWYSTTGIGVCGTPVDTVAKKETLLKTTWQPRFLTTITPAW